MVRTLRGRAIDTLKRVTRRLMAPESPPDEGIFLAVAEGSQNHPVLDAAAALWLHVTSG
jgi:hypothetical protein